MGLETEESVEKQLTTVELAKALSRCVFRYADEKGLQDGIEQFFVGQNLAYKREVRLTPADRIDFMHGEIGVEVKVDSSTPVVQRQLKRYADHPDVKSLLLVTTRQKHRSVAATLNDKPIYVVALTSSIF